MSAPQDNLILFTPGTVIQSAQVNQNFNDLAQLSGNSVGSQLQTLLSNNFNAFVQSGGIITTASGLTVNMAAAYIVVAGITYYMPAQAFTVTASKDTYIDFVPGSIPVYQAQNVANNAASPALYATNAVRMGKIVSGASSITSIVQYGVDSLNNTILPNGSVHGSSLDANGFFLNVRGAISGSGASYGTGDNTFVGICSLTFTVAEPCIALVTAIVTGATTSDFELHPQIYLDGVKVHDTSPPAAVENSSSRGVQRQTTYPIVIPTAGTHTLAPGAFFSAGSGTFTVSVGGAEISAIIFGKVTA